MRWFLVVEIIYIVVLILVCLRIVYDTRNYSKTLAYLLFAIFVPVIGILFYFSFGINYRKRKMYSKKLITDDKLATKIRSELLQYFNNTLVEHKEEVSQNKELALMLFNDINSPLTSNNSVKLLVNGENKFPEVLEVLRSAKHHIHIEYYIYEDDEIGRSIEEILIEKVKEGVIVRFIYDDFGSRSVRKRMTKHLNAGGVQAVPFSKVTFIYFANRLNYRNHRKIIVVDGSTAFVGGINVSDKYINSEKNNKQIYWRDTHLRIDGPGTFYLQYLFLSDWNFCANETLEPDRILFPFFNDKETREKKVIQIAASGPDSDRPTIMLSMFQAINLASKEILITTPYFIPGDSLIDALVTASLSGVSVKLLVPGISDSHLVNFAARSYYNTLLKAGVEIYLYTKGFVHAKTIATDRCVAIVGTANMDQRSFELNFEVNAIVYDREIAGQLSDIFYEDIKGAEKIDGQKWNDRPWHIHLLEQTARMISPML
ncbi:MAG: cardiolipin synthase [Ginsengibacter sp.]